jgi:uncharacterized protein DUF397
VIVQTEDWQVSSFCGEGNSCVGISAHWQRSSHCGEGNGCVEASATAGPSVHLRESDDPAVVLTTTSARLRSLLAAVKDGRLA